jgi:hypothetical protein
MENKFAFSLGVITTLIFHISNRLIFNIGIFPFVMIASITLYFNPDWPRRLLCRLQFKKYTPVVQPVKFSKIKPRKLSKKEKLILYAVLIFLIWWFVFPLRNFVYPGNVAWNENGHVVSFL